MARKDVQVPVVAKYTVTLGVVRTGNSQVVVEDEMSFLAGRYSGWPQAQAVVFRDLGWLPSANGDLFESQIWPDQDSA